MLSDLFRDQTYIVGKLGNVIKDIPNRLETKFTLALVLLSQFNALINRVKSASTRRTKRGRSLGKKLLVLLREQKYFKASLAYIQ